MHFVTAFCLYYKSLCFGNLVPVESIVDQDHFRTLCLVTGKGKTSFRQFLPYKRTEYKLHDVLLPGKDDESDEPTDSSIRETTQQKHFRKMSFSPSATCSSSVSTNTIEIAEITWERLSTQVKRATWESKAVCREGW
uniref:Gasdermin pore forming domain-containing protein n=1 Tax=Anas platyrhynchos platyrhynchos TaxID=8840 RepID=A0A493SYP5_ANAPP